MKENVSKYFFSEHSVYRTNALCETSSRNTPTVRRRSMCTQSPAMAPRPCMAHLVKAGTHDTCVWTVRTDVAYRPLINRRT